MALLLGLALITLIFSVGQGDYPISALDVLKTLLRIPTHNPDHDFVINTLRLPRALVALAVGIGLAVSGAILQGLTQNPLADPGILGINAGASLAAVSVIVLFPWVPTVLLPVSAFLGAMAVAISIYLLSWRQGHAPMRLILMGIGLGAIVTAFTTVLVTFGEINSVSQALIWLTGSVYGRSWEHLWPLLPWLLGFGLLSWLLARDLNSMNLGEEVARGLGVAIEWRRSWLLLASASLAGSAVATAGTVGFVGLMAPHLARRMVGPAHEGLIPVAALIGGVLVMLSDWVGRSLFAPIEIPCGLITSLLGAPFFLYLLYRR
ncbi:MAG: iron ABC transporter permease [Synechococcaceae cyanobacterium SM2_3_1]|nr:iron ABC transporter permease [Synechococcaceae cyanobacterium SM2_3_1]